MEAHVSICPSLVKSILLTFVKVLTYFFPLYAILLYKYGIFFFLAIHMQFMGDTLSHVYLHSSKLSLDLTSFDYSSLNQSLFGRKIPSTIMTWVR